MIDDLDKTLKKLLEQALSRVFADPVTISFDTPDADFKKPSVYTVDLFLYDVRENRELRSNEWHVERNSDTVIKHPPPVRVDCSYLITAWAGDVTSEHDLLGEVMKALLRHRILPDEVLQDGLKGQEPPVRAKPLQASQLQSLGEFWQAMGGRPKAALNYTVTISVPVGEPVEVGKPVKDKMLKFRLEKEVAP